jgi:hypothetical protein
VLIAIALAQSPPPPPPTTTGFIGCIKAEAPEKTSISSSSNAGGVGDDDDDATKLPVPAANENVESNVCETSLSNADARFWLLPSLFHELCFKKKKNDNDDDDLRPSFGP